jgi:hypothetical protein
MHLGLRRRRGLLLRCGRRDQSSPQEYRAAADRGLAAEECWGETGEAETIPAVAPNGGDVAMPLPCPAQEELVELDTTRKVAHDPNEDTFCNELQEGCAITNTLLPGCTNRAACSAVMILSRYEFRSRVPALRRSAALLDRRSSM